MNPDGTKPLTPEEQAAQQKAIEKAMNEEFSLKFTRGELLAIHSILSNVQLKFGDFIRVKPIIDKIEPIVTVAPDIATLTKKVLDAEPNHVDSIIGAKKETN